jgi:hypothetical protein
MKKSKPRVVAKRKTPKFPPSEYVRIVPYNVRMEWSNAHNRCV